MATKKKEPPKEESATLPPSRKSEGRVEAFRDLTHRIAKGEIEFADPADDDSPLDFDPRGSLIEVLSPNGELVLSAEFPAE